MYYGDAVEKEGIFGRQSGGGFNVRACVGTDYDRIPAGYMATLITQKTRALKLTAQQSDSPRGSMVMPYVVLKPEDIPATMPLPLEHREQMEMKVREMLGILDKLRDCLENREGDERAFGRESTSTRGRAPLSDLGESEMEGGDSVLVEDEATEVKSGFSPALGVDGPPQVRRPRSPPSLASSGQFLGLGARDPSVSQGMGFLPAGSISDLQAFEQYRRQRSTKYHKSIATTFQARSGDEKICYICHEIGHFAKHCKFGIS